VAGHQPPRTPAAGPLQPLALREPPTASLRPPAPREPPTRPLQPSAAGPRHSKPQERPPVGVERLNIGMMENNGVTLLKPRMKETQELE
jgi:hypothetical protein